MIGNSKGLQVKVLEGETEVNEWLSSVSVEVIDFKYNYDWNTETNLILVVYKIE